MPSIKLPSNAVLAIVVVILAVILGAAIAIASSPGSLSPTSTRGAAVTLPTPSAAPTPTPQATPRSGPLGQSVRLTAGKGYVLAAGAAGAYLSTDGGATWTPLKLPTGATTVVADPQDGSHLIAGGTNLQSSRDQGKTWANPKTAPPRTGPYQPLWINPADGTAWLIVRDSHLIRTRDDGVSWKDLTTATALTAPLAISGAAKDQAFVADGSRVIQVDGNGDAIVDRGSLPNSTSVVLLGELTAQGALIAEGNDGAVYTNAAGTAWTKTTRTGAVGALPGKYAWANLDVTTDGGQTWTPTTGLPTNDPPLAFGSDGTKAVTYTYSGTVYTSTDGRSWTAAGKIT